MSSTAKSNINYVDDYRNILAEYDVSKNISNPHITRYEKSEIMAQRITQLSNGVKPLIKLDDDEKIDIREIVKREYKEGVIPFIIERDIGGGTIEYWKFRDLIRD